MRINSSSLTMFLFLTIAATLSPAHHPSINQKPSQSPAAIMTLYPPPPLPALSFTSSLYISYFFIAIPRAKIPAVGYKSLGFDPNTYKAHAMLTRTMSLRSTFKHICQLTQPVFHIVLFM